MLWRILVWYYGFKGVYIKAVGVSSTASIKLGNYKTQSFVVVGNQGMFKVGNKVITFGLWYENKNL